MLTWARPRGEWFLYVEASSSPRSDGISAFYPTANADAGSVLARNGDGAVQVSELNFTFRLADGDTLMLGLIDPSAWLDRGRIANDENLHFLNGSFVNNATIEFPDYTIGAVHRRQARGAVPELVFVVAGSDGIADLPDRSYQDLVDVTAGDRGLFVAAGASWLFDRWSWRAGVWLRSDAHEVFLDPSRSEQNYGMYGVAGWRNGANAVNLRAGLANPEVSIAERFVGIAYERSVRSYLVGVGIASTRVGEGFPVRRGRDAIDAEMFVRIPLFGDKAHITPSLQYLRNPGFDVSPGTSSRSATVFGVRFRWAY